MRKRTRFHAYMDREAKDRLLAVSKSHNVTENIVLETLLEENEKYNFLSPQWVMELLKSELGEKVKQELTEKFSKEFSETRGGGANVEHNCMYVSPFILEPNKIICMRDWKVKSKLIKVPNGTCNICYQKGYVIPKPKTDIEMRAEEYRTAQEKRTQFHKSAHGTGTTRISNTPKHTGNYNSNKFREPFNQ